MSKTNVDQEPELLDVKKLAARLGFSVRKIWAMRDAGHLPPATKIGASVRWVRASIDRWLDAGCPSCRTVRQMRRVK